MDGLWDLDVRNALSLITAAGDCAEQFSRKTDPGDRHTYGTIMRAKLDSLRKTIANLELTLRDMSSGTVPPADLDARREQLDGIKRSYQELEGVLSPAGNHASLPAAQPMTPKRQLDHMSREELYNYRNSMMRAQDNELEMLDSTAGAIHSISTHIKEEVDYHNDLLGDLENAMDTSHTLVSRNRAALAAMIERSSKGRLTFYIVVLTIILILVIVL
ncbi:SNARE protein, putative [Babesia bigemina]|uniref:SNARE protein, putative n=1 Tax=Babesia bigemina TaxID=5866 RepID=A0A061D1H9_BABBI|nr:SNARE protein, putative [Babesia bigemina]CDR94498.1 SNARE protein, putative [Babesia bigemina]|eukprot:XP_012766684.1 SNARE protein, putative [Babesia bigemina]